MKPPIGNTDESLAPCHKSLRRRCMSLQSIAADKVVFAIITCILITSGVAKSWMLAFDPFIELKSGYPVFLLATAVIIEFAIVYILITQSRELKAIATLLLFSTFLIVSMTRLSVHSLNCGCFGAVNVSPFFSFMLNIGVVTSVIWVVRRSGGIRRLMGNLLRSKADRQFLTHIGGLAFGLLILTAISESGSVKAAIASMWNGEESVVSAPVNLGIISEGPGVATAEIVLTNTSSEAAVVVGSEQSCTCLVPLGLGQVIPAAGSVKVPVRVRKIGADEFRYHLRFFLDHPRQFSVDAEIFGRWKSL